MTVRALIQGEPPGEERHQEKRQGRRSFGANMLWTLAGQGVYQGAQFLLLAFLARLTNAVTVGDLALGYAICAPVYLLANMGLRAVQVTDARGDYLWGDYLGLRLMTSSLGLVCIALVGYIMAPTPATFGVIVMVGVARAFDSLSDVTYAVFQRHERMNLTGRSLVLKGVIGLTLFGGTVAATRSLLPGVLALAATSLLVLVLHDARFGADLLRQDATDSRAWGSQISLVSLLRPRWNRTTSLRLIWVAAPLGINLALLSLEVNLPRYFIEHDLGRAELGVYAAMAYLTNIVLLVIDSMGQAVAPRLVHYLAVGDMKSFNRMTHRFLLANTVVSALALIVAYFAGNTLLSHIYGPEYARAGVFAVLVFAWSQYAYGAVAGFGLTAARKFRQQLPPVMVSTCALLLACALMVPRYGLIGAAIATAIAMTVRNVYQFTTLIRLGLFSLPLLHRPPRVQP